MMKMVSKIGKGKVEGNLGEKKAVLIGLKHPQMNDVDVKGMILRMKKFLIDLRGFSENNITLLIEDGEEDKSQPTQYNIRMQTCYLVENAKIGDVLFIHLIAHGCSQGSITSSNKVPIPDCHFRCLLRKADGKGCALTIVSDCLIKPYNSVCCGSQAKPNVHDRLMASVGYLSLQPSYLSPVDILKPKPIFRKMVSSIFRKRNLPNTPVVLFNAFRSQEPEGALDRSELFFPPPEVASSTITTPPPNQCGFYGAFTSAILDIIEETQGQVTNLELAQKATEKTSVPGLLCNHSHHAYVPFIG